MQESPLVSTVEANESTPRWKILGPGLVVAATGVGAADLVATLIAGSKYGYALLWCIVIGCILKIALVEGAGRYSLATGHTIYHGWRSLGAWTSVYFGPYIVIWGFVYGASAMAGTGLALYALTGIWTVNAWGIISGLVGLALVWSGKYLTFEKVLATMVGLMFVSMVTAAILTLPNLPDLLAGLAPTIPDGALVNVLSVAGGVGGTITLAAYGYWLREKGWSTPKFMRVMRIDNTVAYVVTGIFVIATLIVGAELLYSAGIAVSTGDRGLLDVSVVLGDRYGEWAGKVFLVGFWSAAMSSVIGVWNGVSLMFADFVSNLRGKEETDPEAQAGGIWYRAYVLWLTFPPMIWLLLTDQPAWLILIYGVLGAFFMPFLAITLLWILNTNRVPREWRNKWLSNALLVLCTVIFGYLAYDQAREAITGFF